MQLLTHFKLCYILCICSFFVIQKVSGQLPPRSYFNFSFENNFENDRIGDYNRSDFTSDWNQSGNSRQSTMDIVSESDARHSKFMRGYFPKGTYGPYNGGWSWYSPVSGKLTEAYFSYDVRFKSGFQWVSGGKIPGITGGSVISGVPIKSNDGFSIRPLWKKSQLEFYVYHQDQRSVYGDAFDFENFTLTSGKWYNLTIRVVLNSTKNGTGNKDGILEGFIDGKLVFQKTNFRFRNTDNITIDRLYICSFFGGSGSQYSALRDEWIDTDNYSVYNYSSSAPNVPKGRQASSRSKYLLHPDLGNISQLVENPTTGSPEAPRNLINTHKTSSALTLHWNDNSYNEEGFKIYRSTSPDKNFTEVGQVSANEVYFTNSSLPPMTHYYYKVNSYNKSGTSAFTNVIGITTLYVGKLSSQLEGDSNGDPDDSYVPFDSLMIDATDSLPALTNADEKQAIQLEVFPNPVSDNTIVHINRNGTAENTGELIIRLVDFNGNEFMRETVPANETDYSLPISFYEYPKGSYYIQVISGSKSQSLKVEYTGRN